MIRDAFDWFMLHPIGTLTPMGLLGNIALGWWIRGGWGRWQAQKVTATKSSSCTVSD